MSDSRGIGNYLGKLRAAVSALVSGKLSKNEFTFQMKLTDDNRDLCLKSIRSDVEKATFVKEVYNILKPLLSKNFNTPLEKQDVLMNIKRQIRELKDPTKKFLNEQVSMFDHMVVIFKGLTDNNFFNELNLESQPIGTAPAPQDLLLPLFNSSINESVAQPKEYNPNIYKTIFSDVAFKSGTINQAIYFLNHSLLNWYKSKAYENAQQDNFKENRINFTSFHDFITLPEDTFSGDFLHTGNINYLDSICKANDRCLTLKLYLEQHKNEMSIDEIFNVQSTIAHVEKFYANIQNIIIYASHGNNIETKELFNNLLDIVMNYECKIDEHNAIAAMLLNDSEHDVMVLTLGSANNANQFLPSFARNDNEKFMILNMDPNFNEEDYTIRNQDNKTVTSLLFQISLPEFVKYGIKLSSEQLELRNKKIDSIITCYVKAAMERIKRDPGFKLVLLDCCYCAYNTTLLELSKQLIGSGLFKLGSNLELIHTYFPNSPAVVYNNINEIPNENKILGKYPNLPNKETYTAYIEEYNKNGKIMSVYDSLDSVKLYGKIVSQKLSN